MREFNALAAYPKPSQPRIANRTIKNRLIAAEGGREFFDGDRQNGYGWLKDDGRWAPVAARMAAHYGLMSESSVYGLGDTAKVLEIQCEKGFLLKEFARLGMQVSGTETRPYAISNCAIPAIHAVPTGLPFDDEAFDLVIARGVVYTLNDADAVQCLREIERVGKGKSFITLGAYEAADDRALFEGWSLLGIPRTRPEWLAIMGYVGYRGDYSFVTAETLRLSEAETVPDVRASAIEELAELP